MVRRACITRSGHQLTQTFHKSYTNDVHFRLAPSLLCFRLVGNVLEGVPVRLNTKYEYQVHTPAQDGLLRQCPCVGPAGLFQATARQPPQYEALPSHRAALGILLSPYEHRNEQILLTRALPRIWAPKRKR